jgi:L-Ala-D/L-Glu epimerase / N-acetyl-D-glutamate racemase
MRIRKVEAWPISVPFATSFGVSRGAAPVSDHVLVRVDADDGSFGIGEASPNPLYSYETQETVLALVLGAAAPCLVGQDARALNRRMADLDAVVLGHPFAKSAVEVALFDLTARTLGVPLYQLLGGCVRDRIPVAMPIGIDTVAATVEKAAGYVRRGFRTIKLKVGRDPADDLERLRAVREAVGPAIALRIDGNQGYDFSGALTYLRKMERFDLQYVEQPLPGWDLAGMRRLADALDVPIVADESVMSLVDAVAVLRTGAADGVILKVSKMGIRQTISAAAAVTAAGLFYELSEMGALSVGASTALHVAAVLPHLDHACEIVGPFLYAAHPADGTPLKTDAFDGAWSIPDGPGHGAGVSAA